MADLRSQKAMASRILKCGVSRVWMDAARAADIEEAITAGDVRRLIKDGVIRAKPKAGVSSFRKKRIALQKKKGRRHGRGSIKGSRAGMQKRQWMNRIRAIRALLADLKKERRIDNAAYRDVYVKSKSGLFRSRSHVMIHLERNNLLKKQSRPEGEAK